ncbi:RHS repeat-associated core domain-containing protein, partial [Pseudomonas endophytica]|uniref:RHS repeat-associated core domain-containing protein n=1 Tax=Pseudomonas endophytica TaxID=1563157 RepID=UPI000A66F173
LSVWHSEYQAWGNSRDEWHRSQYGQEQNLRFQGQYLDRETGLHYNTFRFYDPDIGRFTQPDPIGLLGGINLYQYAANSQNWIDPWGLSCKENASTKTSNLAIRIQALLKLYPKVLDQRTGRSIKFPIGIGGKVPIKDRISWGAKERGAFIKEWYDRGYTTPRGGWSEYDIHHIKPREYGGNNVFWNLVPVQRKTHQDLFNAFWRDYGGL